MKTSVPFLDLYLTVTGDDRAITFLDLTDHDESDGLPSGELKKAVENGATLLFFPEPEGDFTSYNSLLMQMNAGTILRKDSASRQLGAIEWEHPAFSQVFEEKSEDIRFPAVKGTLYFSRGTRTSETPLLWYRDKSEAVTLKPFGEGNLIVFGFPLSTMAINCGLATPPRNSFSTGRTRRPRGRAWRNPMGSTARSLRTGPSTTPTGRSRGCGRSPRRWAPRLCTTAG